MKYIILVCDGAADWPIKEFGNKTIFEATDTPYLDWVASHGRMGLLKTIPDSMNPGSEVANMTIMGYNPEKDLTGRGPLEALSANVPIKDTDIAFRCNLITIDNEIIKDYSSGHITTQESIHLIKDLQKSLGESGVDFFPGVQYRHILRLDGKKFSENLILTPPHDQLDKNYEKFLAKPKDVNDEKAKYTAEFINNLIKKSNYILINHEVNKMRAEYGKRMATHIWPWGGGKKPNIIPFKRKYGLTGSVISAVDLIFGLGIAAGLKPIHVEGATGLPDTNYEGKVIAALNELKEKDFVYLHIEAIDEMGHTGDHNKKSAALKDFDRFVVKPILNAEEDFNNELVIIISPDHPTPCQIRTHSREPVPFAIYNPKKSISMIKSRTFSENSGKEGEYGLINNAEEFFSLILN